MVGHETPDNHAFEDTDNGTADDSNGDPEGFAPGVPVYARVTAVYSTLSSPHSNVASVYAPAAPTRPALKVA